MSTPEWTSEKEARLAAANDTLLAEALAHIDRLVAELAAARAHHSKYHGSCSACADRAETVEETHKRWSGR